MRNELTSPLAPSPISWSEIDLFPFLNKVHSLALTASGRQRSIDRWTLSLNNLRGRTEWEKFLFSSSVSVGKERKENIIAFDWLHRSCCCCCYRVEALPIPLSVAMGNVMKGGRYYERGGVGIFVVFYYCSLDTLLLVKSSAEFFSLLCRSIRWLYISCCCHFSTLAKCSLFPRDRRCSEGLLNRILPLELIN